MNERQRIAAANPCRVAEDVGKPVYWRMFKGFTTAVTLSHREGVPRVVLDNLGGGGAWIWQVSAGLAGIPRNKWRRRDKREAERVCRKLLDGVGVGPVVVVERPKSVQLFRWAMEGEGPS